MRAREPVMADEDLTTPESALHDPALEFTREVGESLARAALSMDRRPSLYNLWLAPIRPALEITKGTADKPLAEITMPEFLAWLMVVAYGGMTGYLIGKVAASVVLGPVNRPAIRL